VQKTLSSAGKDLSKSPFLQALAEREELVRNGKLMVFPFLSDLFIYLQCIIFIRDYNKKQQEVSGYIDYSFRLKTEHFEDIFSGKRRLLPKQSDLSYYNWETHTPSVNHTPNFQVIPGPKGILFKNKRDRKIINVDPEVCCYFFITNII
jgi:hypothetical protein